MSLTEPNDAFLEGLYQTMKQRAAAMAPALSVDEDAKKLKGDDISLLWNRRHMTLEQEWELHRARKPDGTPMFTKEQIGLMVFKDREALAKRGGRVEPAAQISWVNSVAKRESAKRAANPPPPDPTHDMLSMQAPPEMAGFSDGGPSDAGELVY